MKNRSFGLAAGFVVVVVVYAVLSSVWTDTSSAWYDALRHPAWQPPDAVFGIIWPLNFLALLVVGVLVSLRRPDVARPALAVFTASVVFALDGPTCSPRSVRCGARPCRSRWPRC